MKWRWMRQFELRCGLRRLVVWLDDDPRLKEGVTCTLKERPGDTWEVLTRYSTPRMAQDIAEKRRYTVGGLS